MTKTMTVQEPHSVNPGEYLIFKNCGKLRIAQINRHDKNSTSLTNLYIEGHNPREVSVKLNHNGKVVFSCEFIGKSLEKISTAEEVYEKFPEYFI